ncbi:four helix bundle protein [Flavobacterium gossypii]|jgi:four helix bundle protein|uniref:Four helix bundle protein n=1 Tax=Flavobacterium gossypii TaxID=1646119 RepID=A0ABR6DM65_9FLAO|nr:four helix bundle protein [Flavobacterium gossypii]MBA9072776.1 four helix bundle protein [Flavobacterium gossypii]
MRDFRKYDIWQSSHSFTLEVYKITSHFPKEEIYNLTSQIRRASSSIPTNISEGCGRNSDKEFNQFLNIALGSANETEYLLILSRDLQYINNEIAENLLEKINSIKSKIYNLKQKLISPTA